MKIEKLIKPDPKIWKILLGRYQINAKESIFIDNNAKNIAISKNLGFIPIHLTPETNLEKEVHHHLGIEF